LRTFRIVARTLHFRRASEELNLSQPAVSHQIKSLERELGEQLFVKGRRGELIGFLPSTGIVTELENGELIRLQIQGFDLEIEAYLFWKPRPKSASIETLVRYMIERELPGLQMSKLRKSAES